jgi:hypothetical protein
MELLQFYPAGIPGSTELDGENGFPCGGESPAIPGRSGGKFPAANHEKSDTEKSIRVIDRNRGARVH